MGPLNVNIDLFTLCSSSIKKIIVSLIMKRMMSHNPCLITDANNRHTSVFPFSLGNKQFVLSSGLLTYNHQHKYNFKALLKYSRKPFRSIIFLRGNKAHTKSNRRQSYFPLISANHHSGPRVFSAFKC